MLHKHVNTIPPAIHFVFFIFYFRMSNKHRNDMETAMAVTAGLTAAGLLLGGLTAYGIKQAADERERRINRMISYWLPRIVIAIIILIVVVSFCLPRVVTAVIIIVTVAVFLYFIVYVI